MEPMELPQPMLRSGQFPTASGLQLLKRAEGGRSLSESLQDRSLSSYRKDPRAEEEDRTPSGSPCSIVRESMSGVSTFALPCGGLP